MNRFGTQARSLALASGAMLCALTFSTTGTSVSAQEATSEPPPGRSIAYVLTTHRWSMYETKDAKEECPNGLNDMGPREQFKAIFPDDGTRRKIVDTQLAREAKVWFPVLDDADPYPIKQAAGKYAIGLDLDGKTKPTDFTSPDGKAGVDNQLYRAIGCIGNYRSGASVLTFDDTFFKKYQINRILFEITDVDSLADDDDVTVTTYRGRDPLVTDATGNAYLPGGTQRLDLRWGKQYIRQVKGKIVGGVLKTEPFEFLLPAESAYTTAIYFRIRDGRFELALTPTTAEGIVAGYTDVDNFHFSRNRQWSTHHLSYGQQPSASLYKVLRRLADAYPDPVTGENTAISSSVSLKFVQVHLLRNGTAPRSQQTAQESAPRNTGSR